MSEALQTAGFSRNELEFVTGKPVAAPPPSVAAPKAEEPARKQRPRVPEPISPASGVGAARTVSMTFRLPADLPALLIQISAERKVRCEAPFSQQDIVAEALRKWIRAHSDHGLG